MIFQCPSCRGLVSLSQAERGETNDTIGLRCSECGAATSLPLVATATQPAATVAATALQTPSRLTTTQAPAAMHQPAPSTTEDSATDDSTNDDSTTPPAVSASMEESPLVEETATAANAIDESPKETSKRQQRITDAMQSAGPPSEDEASLVGELMALVSTWDDVDAHKRLVRRAGIENKLSTLGPRYRAVLNAFPDDDTTQVAQQEILNQAMARMQMVPSRSGQGLQPGNTAGKIAMVVIASLIAVAIWIMVGTMRSL